MGRRGYPPEFRRRVLDLVEDVAPTEAWWRSAVHPDDLKEVVYTMRYDRASAVYADFGPFSAPGDAILLLASFAVLCSRN